MRDGCEDFGNTATIRKVGISVSDDDIWKTFETWRSGGSYGYNEPLAYAPTSFRHKYVWVKRASAGSLTVRVVDKDNNPLPMATVTLKLPWRYD